MKTSDFDFELPDAQIALHPAARREDARLLVLDRATGSLTHSGFADIGRFLPPRSLLVLNETRVFPARLRARRATGGHVELLLVRPLEGRGDDDPRAGAPTGGRKRERWEAMARNAGNLAVGAPLFLESEAARSFDCAITYLGKAPANGATDGASTAGGASGLVHLAFSFPVEGEEGSVLALAEAAGEIPLPPYIEQGRKARAGEQSAPQPAGPPRSSQEQDDRTRYQTVYARAPGAVAAPTAGLHFTAALLESLGAAGHEVARLVLHVGPGTFRPVKTEDPSAHVMDEESYEIPASTAEAVARARREGRAIIAVGTTSVRALESAARASDAPSGGIAAGRGATRLFLVPGSELRVVDGLVTNFHLPRSTLLMLVSALAGREHVMAAYAEAVARGYRFYSYGDAMLIRP